jgi:gentisate 1,2-dioxygenase
MGVGGQRHAPAILPQRKTRYPLYRRLGRFLDRYGRVKEISTSMGFELRTVQPVTGSYTDDAIPAHLQIRLKWSEVIGVEGGSVTKHLDTHRLTTIRFAGF